MDTNSSVTEEELDRWARDNGTPPHLRVSVEGIIDGHRIRMSCDVACSLHDRAERYIKRQAKINGIDGCIKEQQIYEPGEEWK